MSDQENNETNQPSDESQPEQQTAPLVNPYVEDTQVQPCAIDYEAIERLREVGILPPRKK